MASRLEASRIHHLGFGEFVPMKVSRSLHPATPSRRRSPMPLGETREGELRGSNP
jgi:hypothetical protein